MNIKMIGRILKMCLLIEAVFMIPPLLLAFFDRTYQAAKGFIISVLVLLLFCLLLSILCHSSEKNLRARDGMFCVALCWIMMSLLGCLPFCISGEIPRYIDALFEMVSGFTTTGASILSDLSVLSRGCMFWRCFSHWLGGMGVLVFLLALIPISGRRDGFSMHILRAESPGPNVDKLVPRMRSTASILYLLYIVLTLCNIGFLLLGGMNWFEALCIAFGTAGTGGFAVYNSSVGGYSPYIQNVCTVFMLLFGINFSVYYMLLLGKWKEVLRDDELRFYLITFFVASLLISSNTRSMYSSISETFRHTCLQVSSIMTTTGFASTDFNAWPAFSKAILLFLMVTGACGGSTGGGLKCSRILLLCKGMVRNVRTMVHPGKVQTIRVNDHVMQEKVLENTNAYLSAYVLILTLSIIAISIDEFSFETNFSAVLACFNNIGPGFGTVGPTGSFSDFSIFSKLILIFDMLAGRLEIFPIFVFLGSFTKRNTHHLRA